MRAVTALATIFVVVFFMPLIGVLFGAFTGWVVGLFFEDTIRTFFFSFGVDLSSLSMTEVGAGLGFLGSFFRTVNNVNK